MQKSDENITKLESEVDRMNQRPLLRTEEINSITIRLGEYLKKQAASKAISNVSLSIFIETVDSRTDSNFLFSQTAPEEIAKARRLNRLPFIAHPF